MKKTYVSRIQALAVLVVVACATALHAQTYTRLYSYPQTGSGDTGVFSQFLAQGRDANFYSTIATGGANFNSGTAYQMTTAGTLTTIYNFCAQTSCTDGE